MDRLGSQAYADSGPKCFGLKPMAGRLAAGWMLKRGKVVLRRARFRVGSSLGFKSIT